MWLGRSTFDRKFGLGWTETPYWRHFTGFQVRINDCKSMCEAKCMIMSANLWHLFTATHYKDEMQMRFRLQNNLTMHENTKFTIGFSPFYSLQWIWSLKTRQHLRTSSLTQRQLASTENNKRFSPAGRLQDSADILMIWNYVCAHTFSCGSTAIPTMRPFVLRVGQVELCVRPTNGVFVCRPILSILRELKAGGGTQSYRLLSEFISP